MTKAFLAILAIFIIAALMGHCREASAKDYYMDLGLSIEDENSYVPHIKILKAATQDDTVHIRLANFGGNIWVGAILFNAIELSQAHVVMDVEAPSFSMGAMLACAGDEINVQPYSWLMYHAGSSILMGKTSDSVAMLNAANRLSRKMMQQCTKLGILTESQITEIENGRDIYVFPEDIK